MTQRIVRFNLGEIKRFRINCRKCDTTIEVSAGSNEKIINGYCPSCNAYLFEEDKAKALIMRVYDSFQMARELKNISVEMEFEEKPDR